MNQEYLKDADFNTKEWWIRKLNSILKDSDYIAIDNPSVKENNVVVIKKGTLLPHYIGLKPYKTGGKYSLFTKQEIYEITSEQYEVPQPDRVKGKLPHFNQIEDINFAFHLAMVLADDYGWIPPLSEYDPKITKDMWLDFFRNSGRFNDNYQHMMAAMMEIGGQASCIQLEERFGKSSDHYRATAVQMADKVHIYFNTPLYKDNSGKEQLWPLLFTGRKTSKDERGNFIWKLRSPLKEALKEFGIKEEGESPVTTKTVNIDKNLILYGPPGTGKTYSTAIYAVAICDGKSIDELKDYEAVMTRYNALKEEGRIAFTTFHQSYGYEEFIEGIKPYTDEDTKAVSYSVEPGVFKAFCDRAKEVKVRTTSPTDMKTHPRIWGMLLGGTGSTELKKQCFADNEIRLGFSEVDDNDVVNGDLVTDSNSSSQAKHMVFDFISTMEVGDVVVIEKNYKSIDAIGVITGAYDFDESLGEYPRSRAVNWLVKDIDQDIVPFLSGGRKQLARRSLFAFDHIGMNVISQIINSHLSEPVIEVEQNTKPYVFIIDEINRGNISKIFGELITLIEDTKREGMPEAASAILPYSGESFSVPDNVWLLGTMNTADRSIALMDTALRRRFVFAELMPEADVLRRIGADKVDDLDVAAMLEKINERITFLYDREHTIGHAFFTRLKDEPTLEVLSAIFKKSVIPLLQEYFYEDYQKIQLVLADNAKTDDSLKFIKDEKANIRQIFKGSADELIDIEKRYTINDAAFNNIESYKQIL